MLKAADWLRGTAEVRLTGAEPQRFLNRCVERGIPLEDVTAEDPFTLRLIIPARRVKEAKALAERTGCALELLSARGLPRAGRTARRRWAVMVGLGLLAIALTASSLFVWDMEVTENDSPIPDAEILRVLSEQGVGVGSFWPAFRGERIRTEALCALPGLSFLTVNVRAGRGLVQVRAAVPPPEIWDPKVSGDVTAARSGVVDTVYPLSGAALVHRGDAVTEGQLLICGTAAAPHALGEVNAFTYYELTAAAPLNVQNKTYTGRESRRFALILGTHRIDLSLHSGSLPPNCDKTAEIKTLGVDGVFTLPVKWVTETWRPYTVTEKFPDPAAVRQQLETLLSARLNDRLAAGGEVLSTHFSASLDAGVLRLTLRAQCRERIDTQMLRPDAPGP